MERWGKEEQRRIRRRKHDVTRGSLIQDREIVARKTTLQEGNAISLNAKRKQEQDFGIQSTHTASGVLIGEFFLHS